MNTSKQTIAIPPSISFALLLERVVLFQANTWGNVSHVFELATPARPKRSFAMWAVACTAIVLSGCGPDRPSTSAARAEIEGQIQKESKGLIKLRSFEKTNAVESTGENVKEYRLEYAGEIEFTNDCGYLGRGGFFFARFAAIPMEAVDEAQRQWQMGSGDMLVIQTASTVERVKKGERRKISGKAVFEKAEKGWRVTSTDTSIVAE